MTKVTTKAQRAAAADREFFLALSQGEQAIADRASVSGRTTTHHNIRIVVYGFLTELPRLGQ
jgi:hypothetical protein